MVEQFWLLCLAMSWACLLVSCWAWLSCVPFEQANHLCNHQSSLLITGFFCASSTQPLGGHHSHPATNTIAFVDNFRLSAQSHMSSVSYEIARVLSPCWQFLILWMFLLFLCKSLLCGQFWMSVTGHPLLTTQQGFTQNLQKHARGWLTLVWGMLA